MRRVHSDTALSKAAPSAGGAAAYSPVVTRARSSTEPDINRVREEGVLNPAELAVLVIASQDEARKYLTEIERLQLNAHLRLQHLVELIRTLRPSLSGAAGVASTIEDGFMPESAAAAVVATRSYALSSAEVGAGAGAAATALASSTEETGVRTFLALLARAHEAIGFINAELGVTRDGEVNEIPVRIAEHRSQLHRWVDAINHEYVRCDMFIEALSKSVEALIAQRWLGLQTVIAGQRASTSDFSVPPILKCCWDSAASYLEQIKRNTASSMNIKLIEQAETWIIRAHKIIKYMHDRSREAVGSSASATAFMPTKAGASELVGVGAAEEEASTVSLEPGITITTGVADAELVKVAAATLDRLNKAHTRATLSSEQNFDALVDYFLKVEELSVEVGAGAGANLRSSSIAREEEARRAILAFLEGVQSSVRITQWLIEGVEAAHQMLWISVAADEIESHEERIDALYHLRRSATEGLDRLDEIFADILQAIALDEITRYEEKTRHLSQRARELEAAIRAYDQTEQSPQVRLSIDLANKQIEIVNELAALPQAFTSEIKLTSLDDLKFISALRAEYDRRFKSAEGLISAIEEALARLQTSASTAAPLSASVSGVAPAMTASTAAQEEGASGHLELADAITVVVARGLSSATAAPAATMPLSAVLPVLPEVVTQSEAALARVGEDEAGLQVNESAGAAAAPLPTPTVPATASAVDGPSHPSATASALTALPLASVSAVVTTMAASYPRSYESLVRGKPVREAVLSLLQDYQSNPFSLFFRGHWNRHHRASAGAMIAHIQRESNLDITTYLNNQRDALMRTTGVNQQGSLLRRLNFALELVTTRTTATASAATAARR